jgi:7-cyano-7-deazaguanine synthase
MNKIVIGLSGGMDSATLLGMLLNYGYEVHCCSFMYGSKHGKWELESAKKIIQYYLLDGAPVYHHIYNLTSVFDGFESALLKTGEAIPEGHYNDENMRKTVVPGRNLIFASIMAGLAESIGANLIELGVHAGDHHIYPDCRFEFIHFLHHTVYSSSDEKVQVRAPFIEYNKADILRRGLALPIQVPYQLTRTCYKDQELACGLCGSCRERIEAFEKNGIKDPVQYGS